MWTNWVQNVAWPLSEVTGGLPLHTIAPD
ncbi:hypothetical protein MPLB_20032 [Mesorhizobium sp. ORS 3324]|nr:hypothetical protein MPLB_20032 [Mesorhizobium sp. ORS 3324]